MSKRFFDGSPAPFLRECQKLKGVTLPIYLQEHLDILVLRPH